jgi:acyl carrier protein
MVGYSLGEYVAACLAGVISLEDSLKLVAERSRLIESLPPGALVAAGLSNESLLPLLGDDLSVMAVNGPEQSVVSGPPDAINALQAKLDSMGTAYRRLQASHAFHSKMMEPIFESVVDLARTVELRPPQIQYISNVTGTWIRAEEATDPVYWARHMCQPVRFSESVEELLKDRQRLFLEVGPPLLSTLIQQHPAAASGDEQPITINLLRHSYETQPDLAHALQALGKLWLLGVQPDWPGFYANERRRRLLLPTYPFERQRYWIDTQVDRQYAGQSIADAANGEWFYVPSWKRAPLVSKQAGALSTGSNLSKRESNRQNEAGAEWWVLLDEGGLGDGLADQLERLGHRVTRLHRGDSFNRLGPTSFTVGGEDRDDYAKVITEQGGPPGAIVYLWSLPGGSPLSQLSTQHSALSTSPGADLFELSSALQLSTQHSALSTPLWIVSDRMHEVTGDEMLQPEQAGVLGASTAIERQFSSLNIRNIDVVLNHHDDSGQRERLAGRIVSELVKGSTERIVAYRGSHRWVPTVAVTEVNGNGVARNVVDRPYLIVNGLGPFGLPFCQHLSKEICRKLILIESSGLPPRDAWDEWLAGDVQEGLVSARIRGVRSLEEHGEVMLAATDLSNPDQVRLLMKDAKDRFGGVQGAIYFLEPETACESHETNGRLASNIRSLLVLDELLRNDDLEIRLLVSHTRGKDAFTASDCAFSLFLDAFASQSARNGHQNWTSVTWELSSAGSGREYFSQAIDRLFHLDGSPQVIVSTEPLVEGWSKIGALLENSPVEAESGGAAAHYPRPALRVEYVSPRTEVEETIADIWRDLLGVDQVGIHDNFLELGGDSLLAVRLISRMRDEFHQDLPIRLIFEASTVAELAKAVAPKTALSENLEIAELMSMLDSLSEEEVEQELLKRRAEEA